MWLWSFDSCFHRWKNYKNRPRNARVIVENKWFHLLWNTLYIIVLYYTYSIQMLHNVLLIIGPECYWSRKMSVLFTIAIFVFVITLLTFQIVFFLFSCCTTIHQSDLVEVLEAPTTSGHIRSLVVSSGTTCLVRMCLIVSGRLRCAGPDATVSIVSASARPF